jgi:hypothetical protein
MTKRHDGIRKGQRGSLRDLAGLEAAAVEVVRVADASLTVRFLAPHGAYSTGDTLVVNHYQFRPAPPANPVADAIRTVTAKLQRAIDEGQRSRAIDADDLAEMLLAIADELDPLVTQAKAQVSATRPRRN